MSDKTSEIKFIAKPEVSLVVFISPSLSDNFLLFFSTVIAGNLLLVDEVMKAGMSSLKG